MPEFAFAPAWARYSAKDFDGNWHWFEKEPIRMQISWNGDGGKKELAEAPSVDWKDSLEDYCE